MDKLLEETLLVPSKDIKDIVQYFVFWTFIYALIAQLKLPDSIHTPNQPKLSRINELDVKNRIVSFIHASLQIFMSGKEYFEMSG